jgi:hypothetical protein
VKPGIFDRVRTSVQRGADSCIEMHAWEPHYGICCTDDMNIAHISAGIGFWEYAYRMHLAHLSECYTFLKHATLYTYTSYIQAGQQGFNTWL